MIVVSETEGTDDELVVTHFKVLSQYSSSETEKPLFFQKKSQLGTPAKRYRFNENAR
jgi:hypothetical protein